MKLLDGVRVVTTALNLPGPAACARLRDLGAAVSKVEPPEGDPFERFCVVSFVWAPGAVTPVHDHQMWGMVGMLRGSETSLHFAPDPATGALTPGLLNELKPGDVELLLPAEGDIHQVTNALTDQGSISIHVYGANIGAVERATYNLAGTPKRFISGYANETLPNIWDCSQ